MKKSSTKLKKIKPVAEHMRDGLRKCDTLVLNKNFQPLDIVGYAIVK
jgi:hypothetical protein